MLAEVAHVCARCRARRLTSLNLISVFVTQCGFLQKRPTGDAKLRPLNFSFESYRFAMSYRNCNEIIHVWSHDSSILKLKELKESGVTYYTLISVRSKIIFSSI